MEKERDTRVIYIKDLLFAALYQWRRIVILAVVFALLLGGRAGIQAFQEANAPEAHQAEQQAYEEQKAALTAQIADTQIRLNNQQEYLEGSPIMQLDPYAIYTASAEFFIQTDYQILPDMTFQNPDNIDSILYAYTVMLNTQDLMDRLAESIGIESKYVSELLLVTNQGASARTLSIAAVYKTPEGAQALLDIAIDALKDAKEQIDESIGVHEIHLVTSTVTKRCDPSYSALQSEAYKQQQLLNTTLIDLQKQLNELSEPQFGFSVSIKEVVVMAILGGILGAALVVVCAWIVHIASGKVYSARTLENRTGLKIMGCIPSAQKRCAFDLWLRKLEGRTLAPEQLTHTAVNIRNYCSDIHSVLLAGDCDEAVREPIIAALRDAGLQPVSYGSLQNSVQALQSLPDNDAVLFVLRCHASKYANVDRELTLAKDHGKHLLGCVLIDG